MGTWGKLALGENEYLGKRVSYPKFPKGVPRVPCVHFSKCLHVGTGANGHLDVWRKEVAYLKCPNELSQVPCAHFPQFFEMGSGENGHLGNNLGEMGTGHLGCSVSPNVHLSHWPFINIWGNGFRALEGTPLGNLGYSFPPNVHLPQCPFAYI